MCFAYKTKKQIKEISIQIIDSNEDIFAYGVAVETMADNAWHYKCVDLFDTFKKNSSRTDTAASLNLFSVS